MKKTAAEPQISGAGKTVSPAMATVLLLLFAAILRTVWLQVELQYDELWTLINFTPLDTFQILTDLSLPNNHPVNTLVLKFLSQFTLTPAILRLGVFFCGIGVVHLTGKCAEMLSGDRGYSLAARFLAALSMPLIYFSVYARGYMFQIAGLQLCILGMYKITGNDNDKWAPFMVIGGGILCCLSVSSGIMFLLCAAVGHLLIAPKEYRFKRKLVVSSIALGVILLIYYAALYSRIKAGQQWGIEINSTAAWFNFAAKTVAALLPLFLIPWVIAGAVFDRRWRKVLLAALLPLLLAIITKGGPERVYLPLALVFILCAASGFNALWKKFPQHKKILLTLLVASGIGNWMLPEPAWQLQTPAADLRQVLAETTEKTMVILPGTAGFPVTLNAPEVAAVAEQRAQLPAEEVLMLHCANGEFNGSDMSHGEVAMSFPLRGKMNAGIPGYCYPLSKCETAPKSGSTVLVRFSGTPPEEFIKYSGRKIRLNLWLNKSCQLYICEVVKEEFPAGYDACYQIGECVNE